MKVAIASDHAGFNYKEEIKSMLSKSGYTVTDYGTYNTDSCDYPDFAITSCNSVISGENEYAVLVCGTGIGMSMAANKIDGIRCAVCPNEFCATNARRHNNANVIAIGERVVDIDLAKKMVNIFLTTDFEGGRHQRRVDKIMQIEKGE